jgi:hypothetical protein
MILLPFRNGSPERRRLGADCRGYGSSALRPSRARGDALKPEGARGWRGSPSPCPCRPSTLRASSVAAFGASAVAGSRRRIVARRRHGVLPGPLVASSSRGRVNRSKSKGRRSQVRSPRLHARGSEIADAEPNGSKPASFPFPFSFFTSKFSILYL